MRGKALTHWASDELHQEVGEAAKVEGVSVSGFVRLAIEEALDRRKRKRARKPRSSQEATA